jgi:protein-S-isoprenylcysteine O-methyltransferase Ste14
MGPPPSNNVNTSKTRSSRSASIFKVVLSILYAALIFIAAGTIRWPRFWFFLGFYVISTSAFMIWLKKRDPGLLKERMTVKKDVKKWDKNIIRVYTALLFLMFIVAPLDAIRFRWSRVPSTVQWLAFAGIVMSWGVVFWAFRENAFLSGFVRIQTDRGHTVCSSGPYRMIRHPMYLAVIISVLCLPIFLGSLYSLIPAALVAALFVLRTSLEDQTLRKELPGYDEYAGKVRWRLLPKLW